MNSSLNFKRTFPYMLAIVTMGILPLGGIWTYSGIVILFLCHPLLDFYLGRHANFEENLDADYFNFLTLAYVPFQLLMIFYAAYFYLQTADTFEKLGILLSTGVLTGGLGITVGHELVHRQKSWERALGITLLAMVNYTHFRIEHVFGHHRHVATPEDPASAKLNQSVYAFLPQSLIGSYISAFAIDWKRAYASSFLGKIWSNRTIWYTLFSLVVSFLLALYQFELCIFWWGQSFIAILLLEVINYVEHYGLQRKQDTNGNYEAVTPMHSWDCDFYITNLTLFNLGRHSHHHDRAAVPYWDLTNRPNVPVLPFGYSFAIILAFVPWLWKRKMNPLVMQRMQS